MLTDIFIVDTETTGLDPKDAQIIEVAVVRYNIASACVVSSFASLVHAETNAAESVNRIPVDALRHAPIGGYAWNRIGEIVDCAPYEDGAAVWMAHRAEFDRAFLNAAAPGLAARLPWVCSKFDVEWPDSKPGASCVELALAHGVPVASAHRALTDCMLLANTLTNVQRGGTSVAELMARAMRPRVMVKALVSYDNRELAKAAGFAFGVNGDKSWTKRVARDDLEAFRATLPFKIAEV